MIHVVSSLQAPKCIKETDVSNSKFRQLFATHFASCYYRHIISNLDYFCMGPSGSSTWRKDLQSLTCAIAILLCRFWYEAENFGYDWSLLLIPSK